MFGWDWQALSVIVALALGIASVALKYWLPARQRTKQEQRAELEVRIEHFMRQDTGRVQGRFVIVNHGPHPASDVQLDEPVTDEGESWSPRAINWTHPVPILQPGQDHHLLFTPMMNDPPVLQSVRARWNDGTGRREAVFALSPRYV